MLNFRFTERDQKRLFTLKTLSQGVAAKKGLNLLMILPFPLGFKLQHALLMIINFEI